MNEFDASGLNLSLQQALKCSTVAQLRVSEQAAIVVAEYCHDEVLSFPDKAYPAHEINLTICGSWEIFGRSGKHELFPGDILAYRANDGYGCRHDPHVRSKSLAVSLATAAIDPDEPSLFDAEIVQVNDLQRRIRQALRADYDEHFETLVFEIFDLAASSSRRDDTIRYQNRVRMQRAKRWIERHAFERIQLKDIAGAVGLSQFTCLRQFKAACGTTPYTYVTSCRIREATRLLAHSRQRIDVVSRSVGYPDPAHFSRVFKRRVGVPPLEFRKQAGALRGRLGQN